MYLTFELKKDDCELLEINGDADGLRYLSGLLLDLINKNHPDHLHLMVSEWGGNLSSEVQGLNNEAICHVKIFLREPSN